MRARGRTDAIGGRRVVVEVVSSVRARARASARSRVKAMIDYAGTGAAPTRPRVVARASTPSPSPSTPSPSPSPSTTTTTRGGVSIRFERCRREDLARVTTMERASYPADEAASAMRLEMRQREAGEFFMVARAVDSMDSSVLEDARASDASGTAAAAERAALDADARSIVGYVCGTLASGDVLDESTMSSHDPSGDVLAIHSVCVDERFRRRGVAASALAHYVARWIVHDDTRRENDDDDDTTTTPTKVRRVRLLCKENLIPFYERYGGFALEGASAVEHGAETWFDMVLDLA